jgi:hypothetical protein
MTRRQPPDREPLTIAVPSDLFELLHSGFHSSVPPLSARDERRASGHDRTRRWGQFKTSQWGQFRSSFSWPPPWSTLDMSNADFDTRNTSPGTRPTTAKPAENGRKHRPSAARSAQPQQNRPSGTRPTPPPATTGDSPKPLYLRAIHCQFSPPRAVPSKELHPAAVAPPAVALSVSDSSGHGAEPRRVADRGLLLDACCSSATSPRRVAASAAKRPSRGAAQDDCWWANSAARRRGPWLSLCALRRPSCVGRVCWCRPTRA